MKDRLAFLFVRSVLIFVLIVGWFCLPFPAPVNAAPLPQSQDDFSQTVDLPLGISNGAAAWGDFNNDGNPDLLVSGLGYAGTNLTRTTLFLYNENKSTLEPISLDLPRLDASSIAWGDYDHDGYLDLLLTGRTGATGFAGIYHNVPHTPDSQNPSERSFTLVQTLAPIYQGTGVWADFNNDGCLDVLISGWTGSKTPITKLYLNNGGSFSEVLEPVMGSGSRQLIALGNSAAAWQDYDQDGYPDLVLSGRTAGMVPTTLVYHHHAGAAFFDSPIYLPGLWQGTVNWIDYAGDGRPGLLLTGNAGMNNSTDIIPTTHLYRVDMSAANPFVEVPHTGLPDVWNSSVSVGDFNNDGYADIALNGLTTTVAPADVYVNRRDGTFEAAGTALPHSAGLALAWGDFNGDRSLDLAVTGILEGSAYHTKVFINAHPPAESYALGSPTVQAACWDGANQLTLLWEPPVSSPTPSQALTYNLRLGVADTGIEFLSPGSDLTTGAHRLPEPGSTSTRLFTILTGLERNKTYSWSVQAEDAAYVGGPFSDNIRFPYGQTIANPDQATTAPNTPVTINVLGNDNQTDFGALAVLSAENGLHGTVTQATDGALIYTPDKNYVGTDSFLYYAVGAQSHYCTSARVTVNVVHNDLYPPTDFHLSNNSISEGLPAGTLVGTFNTDDKDNPLDSFTYTLVSKSCLQNNTQCSGSSPFTIQGDRLLTTAPLDHRWCQYPAGESLTGIGLNCVCGTYTFRVRVTDNGGKSLEKDFTVSALASPPSLSWLDAAGVAHSGPASVQMSQNSTPVPFKLVLLAEDAGTAEQLTWSIATAPVHGQASAGETTVPGQAKPDITYTPNTDYAGEDTFTVRVTDPYGNQADIAVNVTINAPVVPVNQPPTLEAIASQVYQAGSGLQVIDLKGISAGAGESGQSVTISVEISPTDGPIQNVQTVYPYQSDPSRGQIQFTVEPGEGQVTFTVTVSDGQPDNGSFSQQFTVTVEPAPTPTPDPTSVPITEPGVSIYLPWVSRGAEESLQPTLR